jgi:hypothetical protein
VDGGESYPFVMVFTGDLAEVGRRGLAIEPMTCAPNAFRTGTTSSGWSRTRPIAVRGASRPDRFDNVSYSVSSRGEDVSP